ncbi:unnamed protein product [Lampetra planeri]
MKRSMAMARIFWALILSASAWVGAQAGSPACGDGGVCGCELGNVYCQDRRLTSVPDAIPTDMVWLYLHSNQLAGIPAKITSTLFITVSVYVSMFLCVCLRDCLPNCACATQEVERAWGWWLTDVCCRAAPRPMEGGGWELGVLSFN